jgi:predicted RNA-binding Zn-ribbon protein involved in translation (DUF1610 family)
VTAPALAPDPCALDGNAAAGELAELFAVEMTTARAACAGCGAAGAIGTLRLYAHGMGLVLRCPSCGAVVLRAARGRRGDYRVDVRGALYLALSVPPA